MLIEYSMHKEQNGCHTHYGPLHEFRRSSDDPDGESTQGPHSWRKILPALGIPVPDARRDAECAHDSVTYFGQQTNKRDVYRCDECGNLLSAEDLSPLAVEHAEVERYRMRAKVQKKMELH